MYRVGCAVAALSGDLSSSLPNELKWLSNHFTYERTLLGELIPDRTLIAGVFFDHEQMSAFANWIIEIRKANGLEGQISFTKNYEIQELREFSFFEVIPLELFDRTFYEIVIRKAAESFEFSEWCNACQTCNAKQTGDMSIGIAKDKSFTKFHDFSYVYPNAWAILKDHRALFDALGIPIRKFANSREFLQVNPCGTCSIHTNKHPFTSVETCTNCGRTKNLWPTDSMDDEFGLSKAGLEVYVPFQPKTINARSLSQDGCFYESQETLGMAALKPQKYSVKRAVQSIRSRRSMFFMRSKALETILQQGASGFAFCPALVA
ncbi:MAG: hypothetical protein KIS92_20875 [Planctomycetota bacterium]|nr:hypothetical protein [Planctomycetota bacterium]